MELTFAVTFYPEQSKHCLARYLLFRSRNYISYRGFTAFSRNIRPATQTCANAISRLPTFQPPHDYSEVSLIWRDTHLPIYLSDPPKTTENGPNWYQNDRHIVLCLDLPPRIYTSPPRLAVAV